MPRAARFVVPNVPHHIIQRGNRCQPVFFSDDDRAFYLGLLAKWGRISGVTLWAYCLMDNHVHLVAIPAEKHSLAVGLGETHKAYTKAINEREGWRGFLWQDRFRSYPMDETYLYRAIRYVELNPGRAKIVTNPADYAWSSARAHIFGKKNALISHDSLGMNGNEWAAFLKEGLIDTEAELFRRQGISIWGTRT